MLLRRHILTICLIFVTLIAMGQGRVSMQSSNPYTANLVKGRLPSPYSLSIKGGLTQFFGELNNQDMRFMAGVSLKDHFTRRFGMSLDFTAGKLGGDKLDFFNSYFVTEYNTIELLAHWDITEQLSKQPSKSNIHLGVYGGLGLMYFSANAFDLNTNQLVRFSNSKLSARNPLFLRWGNPHGPPDIKKTHERTVPLGIAVTYKVTPSWLVGLDYRYNFVRTDKLDATSGMRLTNPEESTTYSDTPMDKFSFFSFSLTHRFTRKFKDSDNDGVPDNLDRCPDTPGSANFSGCPDTDNDGFPDYIDRCPTEAGPKATRGCPDTDRDGVIDRLDECPTVPGKLKGCPDRDGDGVRDDYDGCPDVKGLIRFGGCPDTDRDGIPDHVDKCPTLPGKYENGGCPVQKK